MNLSEQVVSLELAKRLKELGVKQEDAIFYHAHGAVLGAPVRSRESLQENWDEGTWAEWLKEVNGGEVYAAFTVAELGEMLPSFIPQGFKGQYDLLCEKDSGTTWRVAYIRAEQRNLHEEYADTEADARAAMLIYLIENKLITP